MRTKLYSIALLAGVLLIFSSCQKSNDVIYNQRSIEGTWAITGITSDRAYDFNGDGRSETDIYGTYTSCGRDIVLVFNANGYGQIRQGCNSNWQNMHWRFSNNNTTLTISMPDDELNLDITQFDNYSLRGTDHVTINGNYFSIYYTLQRR